MNVIPSLAWHGLRPARHTFYRAILALLLLLGLIPLTTLPAATAEALTINVGDATLNPHEAEEWEELFAELDKIKSLDEDSTADIEDENAEIAEASPSDAEVDETTPSVMVMLHFKDARMQTIDFASYQAAFTEEDGYLTAHIVDNDASFTYQDALQFAVYDAYASFDDRQKDITALCVFEPQAGTVRIPRAAVGDIRTLAIVFWLSPLHPAYQHYVLNELDTRPVSIHSHGQTTVLESDIPNMLKTVRGETAPAPLLRAPLTRLAPSLSGTDEKHFQLNPATRIENFTVEDNERQSAYGFPSSMVGSYGFGVFFGAEQTFNDGIPNETLWDKPVLWTSAGSYNKVLDTFLSDTIAGRRGSKAVFAISCHGNEYRNRYVTTGNSFPVIDKQAEEGLSKTEQAPNNKVMAHGTCGTANEVNGKGPIIVDNTGDNYIVYRGKYDGPQSEYNGWYEFYYKFDAESATTGKPFQNVVGYVLVPPANTGKAEAKKVSSAPDITNTNSQYSLQNAVIAVYSSEDNARLAADKAAKRPWDTWRGACDWARSNADFVLVTNTKGISDITEGVPVGTYYAIELFPPLGFYRCSAVETFSVELNSENLPNTVTFTDVPKYGGIELMKASANSAVSEGNAAYSMEGAVYSVYTDAACKHKYADMALAMTDDGRATAHLDDVPLGEYWIRETTRPAKGFGLDRTVYPLTVADDNASCTATLEVKDPPKLASIPTMIQKLDRQTARATPQGGASLGDAHFRITYYTVEDASEAAVATLNPTASWVVRTNDRGAFPLTQAEKSFSHASQRGPVQNLSYYVSGSEFFKLRNGSVGMPIGTYTIQEVKAPEGYLLDNTVHVRHITDKDSDAEALTTFQAEEAGDTIADSVVRSDVQFTKRANGSVHLAGVPFKLTSKTTGEWHILVTDANGFATTASKAAQPHTNHTNENDAPFLQDDDTFALPDAAAMETLNANAGLWFSGAAPGTEGAAVQDDQGALPYDIYELEELRCPANAPYSLIRDEIIVDATDHGQVIDLGTLNNTVEGTPSIHTEAYNGQTSNLSDHIIGTDADALIIDRVSFSGLTPGHEYQLEAILIDRASGKPFLDHGEEVRNSVVFTPSAADGFTNVPLPFDASDTVEGTQIVVFETLLRHGEEKASHRNLNDAKQTVTVQPADDETPHGSNTHNAPEPNEDDKPQEPSPSSNNEAGASKEPDSKGNDSSEPKSETPKKNDESDAKGAKDSKDKKESGKTDKPTSVKESGKKDSERIPLAQTHDSLTPVAYVAGAVVLGSLLVLALVLGFRYRRG